MKLNKRLCAKNRFCHFVVISRMKYEILPHRYNIISGIFPKYQQKIFKNQQHLPA